MMYLSLLSMYNKEKAMILDSFVPIYCLRSVAFKIVFRRVKKMEWSKSQRAKLEVTYKPDVKIEGNKLFITIVVSCLPQHLHSTELDILNSYRLQNFTINVIPFFASIVGVGQSIDRREWMSIRQSAI